MVVGQTSTSEASLTLMLSSARGWETIKIHFLRKVCVIVKFYMGIQYKINFNVSLSLSKVTVIICYSELTVLICTDKLFSFSWNFIGSWESNLHAIDLALNLQTENLDNNLPIPMCVQNRWHHQKFANWPPHHFQPKHLNYHWHQHPHTEPQRELLDHINIDTPTHQLHHDT